MGSRDGGISVTNDGATILRAIHVDNAAAKVLVNIAKTQASALTLQTLLVVRRLTVLIVAERIWCFPRFRIVQLWIESLYYSSISMQFKSVHSITGAFFLRYLHPLRRLTSAWMCSAIMWYIYEGDSHYIVS